jgi:hypothetical protein
MRCSSATKIKSGKNWGARTRPDPESRIGMLYDAFKNNAGKPLSLKFNRRDSTSREQLMNFYGLDIRLIGKGDSRTGRLSTYVLAGEWFGSKYVDYIAEKLKENNHDHNPVLGA